MSHVDVPTVDRRHLRHFALVGLDHLARGLVDRPDDVNGGVPGAFRVALAVVQHVEQNRIGNSFVLELQKVIGVHDVSSGGDGLEFCVAQASGVVGDAAEVAV